MIPATITQELYDYLKKIAKNEGVSEVQAFDILITIGRSSYDAYIDPAYGDTLCFGRSDLTNAIRTIRLRDDSKQ